MKDSQIKDMMIAALPAMKKMKFSRVYQELQDYPLTAIMLQKERVAFSDGAGIRETIMDRTGGNAKWTSLFKSIQLNVPDLLRKMALEWTRMTTHWAFERREILENKGGSRIVNHVEPRREGAMVDMGAGIELALWTLGDYTQEDPPCNGVPYYIVKNATQGFNGGNAAGYSSKAGIDASTNDKLCNWTDTYSAVSRDDLIYKMKLADAKTLWKSPITIKSFRGYAGKRRRVYMNTETKLQYEMRVEDQNDNLGPDAAPYDGDTVFKRHPIIGVPQLDSDTTNPIYMIDHESMYFAVLSGDYLRESDVEKVPLSNTFYVMVDLSCQLVCVAPRCNSVLYQV